MKSWPLWSKALLLVALAPVGAWADAPIPPSAGEQIAAIDQWNSMTGPAPLGEGGRVILTYGAGPASLICAPNAICMIELGPGELVHDTPALSDPVQWNVELREAIMEGEPRHIMLVKPADTAATAVMTLFTNKRTYSIRLVPDPARYTPRLAFRYPDEERRETERRIALARAAEEERLAQEAAMAAAARALEIEETGIQTAQAVVPASELNFNYRIAGDAPFEPVRIYDDGLHTYIQLPERLRALPIYTAMSQGADEAVNTRIEGRLMIVDGVFDEAALIDGRERIRIRRVGGPSS